MEYLMQYLLQKRKKFLIQNLYTQFHETVPLVFFA